MPELAEVEKIRKLVAKHALNKKIINVTAFEDEIVFENKKPKDIESSLINLTVINVGRKGKIFWMEMDGSGPHISFHLGMTGRMIVRGHDILTYYRYPDKNKNDCWPPRFVKLLIKFEDNTEIAFTNTRRLGRVRLHKNIPSTEEIILKLGFDPFNSMCSYQLFEELILARKCPLKSVLLDQSFSAGVGNWIADEVCYQSGIYPGSYCNKLNILQIKRIYYSLQSIVKYAVSVDANYDLFPTNWLFHYRWNKGKKGNKGKNINFDAFGNEIIYQRIGGRTTAIVLKLQSKQNGYRNFKNSKKIGKLKMNQKKLKINDKYKLIHHHDSNKNMSKKTNSKKKKSKTNSSKKRKLEELDEVDENEKNRKKIKISSEIPYDSKTHILTSKNVLIPIGLLRRSSRLASKNKK